MSICWLEEGTSWALEISHQPHEMDPHSWWDKNNPSGNQERKGQDGFQDLGGPSVERTDCPGGGKEGDLFRGAPGGAGISPSASQWEGARKPPTKGQSQKLIF